MDKSEKLNTKDKGIAEMEDSNSAILTFMDLFIPSEKGIPSIDELIRKVGEYYDANRAYIFEQDITRQFFVNTYEWCAKGVTPEIQNLQEENPYCRRQRPQC